MKRNAARGFSLVETMITVGVVGIVAAIGVLVTSNVVSKAREQKLFSDIDTINRSVVAYIASGGDLSDTKTPEEVLIALKRSVEGGARMPGFSGSKIDERLSAEFQTESDAAKTQWRAYWDADSSRFVLAQSGDTPGIRGFEFSSDPAVAAASQETREATSPLLYAGKDSWIWDFEEAPPGFVGGPSDIPLGTPSDSGAPTPPASSVPPGPSATPLNAPQFSITGGTYPLNSFTLPLALANPNPDGSSDLFYSIDFGNWLPYTGTIQVAPGAIVAAQAIARSDLYTNSPKADQVYAAIPADLLPPIISPSRPDFGLFTDRTLTVTLTDQNSSSISALQYRIGGDPWQDYAGSFTLTRDAYPSGTLVQARAIPVDPYYLASTTTLKTLGIETASISGTSGGTFSNPIGGKQLETNLVNGLTSNYFEWGKDTSAVNHHIFSKSWLDYGGMTFNTVPLGERFALGSLSYYNGTIISGTGADGVSFAVNLNLGIAGLTANTTFDFDFELVNVVNGNNPKDLWADADYVKLAEPVASQYVAIGGVKFQLQLEFGESTADGIALFNEFHVLEGRTATTQLYGTLVEVGSIDFNQ